ncbi:MAG: GAF domain-containing protein [Elusimicrobia bacterium]|nr:GAF domain-containing protein [Elusimicrobiota bacterium]
MLVECPKCSRRHEAPKAQRSSTVACPCGEKLEVLPWLSYRQVITESRRVECPLCSRGYDLGRYRHDTELACGCGSLFVVQHPATAAALRGRRKSDGASRLLEMELHGLIDTTRLIHTCARDLDALLPLVIRISTDMLEVSGTSIALRDKAEGGLVFRYAVTEGDVSSLLSFRLLEGEGVVGNCVSNRASIIVNNVKDDPRFSNKADSESGFVTRSILCVPLIVEEDCIGALEFVNKRSADGFSRHDLLLADAVASQIAIAIRNVQLAQEALEAERLAAIGKAVTGVAHCVKNMLNGLQGGMYILKSTLKKSGAEVSDRGFVMLEHNLGRLTDLVMDMLLYSKEREPEYESSDLNELTASVVELMRPKAAERRLVLAFHPDPGVGKVELEPKGIYRCILNLVSNGLDACQAESAAVDVATMLDGSDGVVIEVRDQGCGMDESVLRSLFQAFFSTKGSKGTGLGLSVTKKIIEEHRGRIQVESETGKGAVFRVRLPRQRPVPLQAKTAPDR